MSNWREYDMDNYARRRDEERKQKQEYEKELARRRVEFAKRINNYMEGAKVNQSRIIKRG